MRMVGFVGSTREVNGVHLWETRRFISLLPEGKDVLTLAQIPHYCYASAALMVANRLRYRIRTSAELCKVVRPFCGAARGDDLTFAVPVRTSEDGAFFNAPERLEKAPHIIF